MVFLGFALARPIGDPDIWWHLSIGDWILTNRTFPMVDHWTTFGEGKTFRAYSWLPETLFSIFYSIGGARGLMLLLVTFSIIFGASLCFVLGYFLKNHRIGVFVGTIVLMALMSHTSLRPQAFTWLYIIWLVYVLDRIRIKELTVYWILPISILWANTHLSTVLGIAITSIFVLPNLSAAFRGGFVFLIGTFFTPYFGGEWYTFFEKLSHPVSFFEIAEFQPAVFISIPVLFILLIISMIIVVMFQERTVPRVSVAFLGFLFTILGMSIVKFLPFAIIFLGLFLVTVMRGGVKPKAFISGVYKLDDFVTSKVIGKGFGIFLVALILFNFEKRLSTPIQADMFPEKSVRFIKDKVLPNPVISTFSIGGYLGYFGLKPAIDGRTNLISKDFWMEYILALKGFPGYESFLERTKPETILWTYKNPLPQILKASGDWCEVFRERDDFVVLVKTASEHCTQ